MAAQPNLKRNVIYQVFYQIFLVITPLITMPYISRVLGAEGLGATAWTASIATYFMTAATLGAAVYAPRQIARVRNNPEDLDREFSALLVIRLACFAIALVAYAIFLVFFDGANRALLAVQGLIIVGAAIDITWFFTGTENFGIVLLRNTLVRIATIAAIFLLVRRAEDFVTYAAILAAGVLLGNLSILPYARKHFRLIHIPLQVFRQHMRTLGILFLPVLGSAVVAITYRVLLGAMRGETEVGFAFAGEKIITIPLTLIFAVNTVIMPRIANLAANDETGLASKKILALSSRYLLMLGCGIAFGIWGVARTFVPVFFGSGFEPTAAVINAWAFIIPMSVVTNILSAQVMQPHHKDKEAAQTAIACLIIGLLAAAILIPRFAALGLVYSLIIVEVVRLVGYGWASRNVARIPDIVKVGWVFPIFGALMFGAVCYLGRVLPLGATTLVIQIGAGVMIYGVICLIYLLKVKDPFATRWLARR